MAIWRCALTTGCGRRARVHPVEVLAPCCPHDLCHVSPPLAATAAAMAPHPRSAREGRGPRRDD